MSQALPFEVLCDPFETRQPGDICRAQRKEADFGLQTELQARTVWRAFKLALRAALIRRFVAIRRRWVMLAFLSYCAGALSVLILGSHGEQSNPDTQLSAVASRPVPAPKPAAEPGSEDVRNQATQNVLVLPRVSRGFLGEWHGEVVPKHLTGKPSQLENREEVGLSLWDREGEVVMHTGIWGGDASQLIRSGARVLGPEHFVFWDETLVDQSGETVWLTSEYDAKLTPQSTIELTETVKYLNTPGADPFRIAEYRGTLPSNHKGGIRRFA